jgi:hypothetical protein
MQPWASVDAGAGSGEARGATATDRSAAMTRIVRTIEVPTAPDDAFRYVADFSTTEEWDPGIEEARRLDDGPIGVGSRFAVISNFGGRRLPITYTITAYEPPTRVVLDGEGSRFRGIDEITFDATPDGGTRITYVADLRLKGIARVIEPLMRSRFEEVGEEGTQGLRRALSAKAT